MRRRTLFPNLPVLIAIPAASACSDRADPVSPPATTLTAAPVPHTPSSLQSAGAGQIVKRTINLPDDIVATQTITPSGGWIPIDSAGMFIYFPPGAVSQELTVTVTAYKGNKVIYSFEPHGTVFKKPVYIGQALRYTELNTPRNRDRLIPWAGYLANGLADVNADGTGNFAETFSASLYGKGNDTFAYFATTHFSGYALASGRYSTSGQ